MMKRAKFSSLFVWMIGIVLVVWSAIAPVLPATAIPMALFQPKVQQEQATVTLVNRFEVAQENVTAFLERWGKIGEYMRQQPGFISAELKKDILSSKDWIMSEKWSSLDAYKKAISNQDFQGLIENFPAKASWFAQELFPSS